jgi:hypothetical protein
VGAAGAGSGGGAVPASDPGVDSPMDTSPPDGPGPFRVLTWNVLAEYIACNDSETARPWEARFATIVQQIMACHPDIVCLQEVGCACKRALSPLCVSCCACVA